MIIIKSLKSPLSNLSKTITVLFRTAPQKSLNTLANSFAYKFIKTKQTIYQSSTSQDHNSKQDKLIQKDKIILGNVNFIMTFYKKEASKQNFMLQNIVLICKSLSQHYSRQNHMQYAFQRKQLQGFLQHLGRLQFKNASFQDYLSIMELVNVLNNVQNITKSFVLTVKDIVSLRIFPYREKFALLSLQKQVRLYCVLSDLGDPQLVTLVDEISKNLKQSIKQTKIQPQIFIRLLQSLAKKQAWLPSQQYLIQIIFQALKKNLAYFKSLQVLKIVSAISSDRFLILKNNSLFDQINVTLVDRQNSMLSNGLQPMIRKYALSKNMQGTNFLTPFYEKIYSMILKDMQNNSNDPWLLQSLCRVANTLRGKAIDRKDISVVISYIQFVLKNKEVRQSVFEKKRCQIYLLDLIQAKYFDQNITILNDIIIKNKIQVYWSFVLEYSFRQALFPLEVIIGRIKPGTSHFKMDTNYLKVAVSIAIQTWLHDSPKLEQSFEQIKNKTKSSNFGLTEIDWLLKQYQLNPKLVKMYHKYYCAQFQQMIYKKYFPILFSNQSISLKYWKYLLLICEPNEKFTKIISPSIIKYMVECQFNFLQNENNVINPMIVQKLIQIISSYNVKNAEQKTENSQLQTYFKSKISKLLLLWFQRLPNADEQTAKLYTQLIILVMKTHSKQNLDAAFKILVAKLAISEYKVLHAGTIFESLKKGIQQHLKDDSFIELLMNLKKRGKIQHGKLKN